MFSPSRVVARLAGYFPPDSSPPTRREIAIADAFKRVLQDALYGDIELEEDEHLLDSLEDAEEVEWTPEDDSDDGHAVGPCRSSRSSITDEMFAGALSFYRSSSKGLPLSYATIRHMALNINRECGFVEQFKGSKSWITKFVRECGLRSRKVTAFVTTRNLRARHDVEQSANAFVQEIKSLMSMHPRSIFCNIDQSGINSEVVSQSRISTGISGSTISIFPDSFLHNRSCIVRGGRLGERLFVVLPESQGRFPERGHWPASNLYVVPSTTHMMRKDQVPVLIKECVMATSSTLTIVMLDSWAGFKDQNNVLSGVPSNKQMKILNVPPGATVLCQPLDVYFFRLFKRFLRRIHDSAIHLKPDFHCFSRDNTLKVTVYS
ncbi:unnamed protein product [Nippostrongylus brasiliensis]|uniref:HTH CENPB-type domain-containing protein n=1 Tax=Nippostrongylus brasiliensis TaxID=27835 RepID=A0A0N4XDY3_NIPBR|nr:unnamed protein product [Nippostrongylus brasiliensis]